MQLLVVVLDREDLLDDVLSALVVAAVVVYQLVGPVLWERAILAGGEGKTTEHKKRAAPRDGPSS